MKKILHCLMIMVFMQCEPVQENEVVNYKRITQGSSLQQLKSVLWKFKTSGAIRGNAVVASDRVLFGSADGNLYAVDKNNGLELWRFKTNGSISSTPSVAAGLVFITSRDNHLYAIDLTSGKEQWKFSFGALRPHDWGWEYFLSSPVYNNNMILVGGGDGVLYAINAANGKKIWSFQTKGRIRSTPLIHNDKVYCTSFDGTFYVVDLADGQMKWKYDTEGATLKSEAFGWDRNSIDSSPFAVGDLVVFGSRDGNLYCLDTENKALHWKFTYGPTWSVASPLIHDGRVFAGWSDNNYFSCVDLQSGKELWKYQCEDFVYSSPVIRGDNVMVGSADGKIYSFHVQTGVPQWRFKTGNSIYASPLVVDNDIYIGSDDGLLYALEGTPSKGPEHRVCYSLQGNNTLLKAHSKLEDVLVKNNFTQLDSAGLESFMTARIEDKSKSLIVFNYAALPSSVLSPVMKESLFRRYMEEGGTIVWLTFPPDFYRFNAKGDFLEASAKTASALLGIDFDIANDGGEYYSQSTTAGLRIGLPEWFIGTYSVRIDQVDEAYAINEYGRASGWKKKIGKGAFIQLRAWSNEKGAEDLDQVVNALQMEL